MIGPLLKICNAPKALIDCNALNALPVRQMVSKDWGLLLLSGTRTMQLKSIQPVVPQPDPHMAGNQQVAALAMQATSPSRGVTQSIGRRLLQNSPAGT